MSTTSIKKILLAGTALVAVAILSTQAYADPPVVLDGVLADDTWAGTGGTPNVPDGKAKNALAGDTVTTAGHMLIVTNNGTANDGSAGGTNKNTFSVGAITGVTAGVDVVTGSANDLSVTLASVSQTGAGNITIENTNGTLNSNTTTVSTTLSTAGTLTLTNATTLGNAVATGVNLIVSGNASVTGATTVTAGGFAGANAVLTLNGASNTLGAVTLNEAALNGSAQLILGSAAAVDTITSIDGASGNQGTLTMLGSNAISGTVGFTNNLKVVNVGVDGTTSSVGGVTKATTINLTGTGEFDATGAVTATNLNINGTGTVKLNAAANNAITTTNFAADGTVVVGAGGTLTSTVTTATTGTGTLTFAGAGTMTGPIGGANLLKAINAGVGAVTVSGLANATTLTFTGANGVSLNGAGTNTFGAVAFGANDGTLTMGAGANLSVTGNVTTTNDDGTLALINATSTIGGAVGAAGAEIKALTTGLEQTASTFTGAVFTKALTIAGTTDAANAGSASFGSTLAVGSGGMVVSSAGATTAQAESATVTGVFTDAGTLAVTAANTALSNATLTLNGTTATNTITGVTTLTDGAAGLSTLSVGTGASITFTGGLTGAGAGQGTLTLAGGIQNVGGVVGSTSLRAVNAGANGATTTFAAAVNATTLNVTGTGAVDLNGATAANILFAGQGSVTMGSGDTLAGSINGTGGVVGAGVGSVTLDATTPGLTTIGTGGVLKSLTINNPVANTAVLVTASGNVNAADTTTLGINTLAVGANTFTLGAGQTLASTINNGATFGKVTSTGAPVVNAGSKVSLTIGLLNSLVAGNNDLTLVSGGAGVGVGTLAAGNLKVNGVSDGLAQTLTEGVMTYSQLANPDNLVIRAFRAASATVAATPNNLSVARALDTIGQTGNAALVAVQASIAAASTNGAVNNILGTLSPTVDGGSQMVALDVGAQVEGITETRMAALRADDGTTGVAAGAGANGTSMWVQGYGQGATQHDRDSVAGYTATTWGGAVGVDSEEIINNGVLGFALNYGHAAVSSKNLNAATTGVDNYGFTLYDTVGLQYQMFVDTELGFAYNKIASVRHNVGGVGGPDADGSTHSEQYNAKALLGQDYDLDYDMIITPAVSAAYTHLNTQGYTETGPGADLTVGSNSQNNLNLGVGTKLAWKLKNPDGSLIKPILHAGYSYAVIDDRIDTTANFTGASPANNPSFATEGPSPERNRFDVGAGITYMTTANWDLSANYNYEYRTDYTANTATLRMTAHF